MLLCTNNNHSRESNAPQQSNVCAFRLNRDSQTAAPGQRHHYLHTVHGDSKSLPNNRTAKVQLFS